MAKVTWLGEDHLHAKRDEHGEIVEEGFGPSATIWNGVKFPKGVPVEVTNSMALQKARGNPFFHVDEDEPAARHRKAAEKE